MHTVGTQREGEYLKGDLRGKPAGALTGPALKMVVERAAPHVVVGEPTHTPHPNPNPNPNPDPKPNPKPKA